MLNVGVQGDVELISGAETRCQGEALDATRDQRAHYFAGVASNAIAEGADDAREQRARTHGVETGEPRRRPRPSRPRRCDVDVAAVARQPRFEVLGRVRVAVVALRVDVVEDAVEREPRHEEDEGQQHK